MKFVTILFSTLGVLALMFAWSVPMDLGNHLLWTVAIVIFAGSAIYDISRDWR